MIGAGVLVWKRFGREVYCVPGRGLVFRLRSRGRRCEIVVSNRVVERFLRGEAQHYVTDEIEIVGDPGEIVVLASFPSECSRARQVYVLGRNELAVVKKCLLGGD